MMRQLQTVKTLAELFQKHENTSYKWITRIGCSRMRSRSKTGGIFPTKMSAA